ncbi:hypothetical protein PHAVU_011G173100 [Phaseolus vulgaris]|uniref:Major facilitator superfamily (MFS) profile domain-containing protein n=1 Tax=Phaseolus vulgaris TaxID=3885 RepID=V7AII3_PHAVU|nr:hypothetical protein PHAVU_011G173100g [Phaseolus vulgaris]ESW05359.1 hypothetical protein PHAVU_011G173100g [Phaseolus vulgaris]
MLGRCLTSLLWGTIADRIGRKPVIIIGIISVKSFWMAVIVRFLLGSLNCLFGPVKPIQLNFFEKNTKLLDSQP